METAHQPEGDLPVPDLNYSLDVNALNFCRFSILSSHKAGNEALIAVPNLVESSWRKPYLVDIVLMDVVLVKVLLVDGVDVDIVLVEMVPKDDLLVLVVLMDLKKMKPLI